VKIRFVCFLVCCKLSVAFSQTLPVDSLKALLPTSKEDTTKVDLLLQVSKSYLNSEPQLAIGFAEEANQLATKLNFQRGIAVSFKNLGIAYYQQGKYIEALDKWNHSLEVFEQLQDKSGIANLQSNIGAIYKNQGNDPKALEYLFNSLRNSEQAGEAFRIASALINIGSVYQHKVSTYDKALEYYLRALPMSEKLNDNDLIGTTTVNIGEIYLQRKNPDSALYYFMKAQSAFSGTVDISYALNSLGTVYAQLKNYDKAKQYHQQAYDSAVFQESKLYMAQALQNLADVYVETGDRKKAIETYLQAEALSKEINSSYGLKEIYTGLAETYTSLSQFDRANKYQTLLLSIKDTIYNKETDVKLSNYEFNFEIEKKQGQITLLEKDKVLQEVELKRQKLATNASIAGLALILIIAFIIYRNYLNKIKVNKLLDSQNAQIEHLLLNILPAEVARELQEDGQATPRYYESVSVLFTDFKGFTMLAEKLTPQEVVAELNDCFTAFDEITEAHNLEKIKTIGDSYMCAGGIPVKDDNHPARIIKAAIEIQQYMLNRNENRRANGLPAWELRIGIHTGPVVAGVVGKNKYAYDIWGGTVNVASRMESNGEPGEINISADTYYQVNKYYDCRYRGKLYAKNVGEIDMYFVEGPRLFYSGEERNEISVEQRL
jgi:class 3 adenylate cyclase/lipopolysaccharide biosynthesis regulator YciM